MPAKKTIKKAPKAKTSPKRTSKKEKTKFYQTGEKCPESGLYEHFCKEKRAGSKIPLSKSETFPPCRTCGSVKWKLIMSAN